ncbi:SIR2 family protein [Persicirhabdus sediminis]|uniref:SIR2 family protein n=1 Tax=Persicirhabdus sediminis TaxID=454144 RepID=A0A8J7MEB4_9BACT|nr:SIR2 family protein [Persicirhabdus sediminis]MBK1791706.1 SIR2 family protein [Persicirhabdus sediminis]
MSKETLEIISKQAQDYYRNTPVIILGSGASAAFGMSGMGNLAKHLMAHVHLADLPGNDKASWCNFCEKLNAGIDLETALHDVPLSTELTCRIVYETWTLLAPEDFKVFKDSLNNSTLFPLGKLLKHMFRSTARELNIITPNYDRLAEYACEQESIHHYTGFSHGYRGHSARKNYLSCSRQVNIWKVHGSLGWFTNSNGVITFLSNINEIPDGLTPLIVTPGIEKYRSTHKEPYKTIIHESDDVMDEASAYLCVGFGFNDEHIQTKLVNRCANNGASVIIITYELTDATKKFIAHEGTNKYLAIEAAHNNKSRIYSSLLDGPVEVDGDFWSLQGFMSLIM